MLLRPSTIRRRLRGRRWPYVVLGIVLLWHVFEVERIHSRLRASESAALATARSARLQQERKPLRIFISSLQWNSEEILRGHFNAALTQLAETLGPANVYVSLLEDGSWDDSAGALAELDGGLAALGVNRSVVHRKTSHKDLLIQGPPQRQGKQSAGGAVKDGDGDEEEVEDGWIRLEDGFRALRRIPYLARLRNRSLEPLARLAKQGVTFDYVLFLNDVVFSVSGAVSLLVRGTEQI